MISHISGNPAHLMSRRGVDLLRGKERIFG